MDLETARHSIQAALERMRASYLQPVFDEWAILSVPAKTGGIVAYHGPRPDVFKKNLPKDAEPLRAVTAARSSRRVTSSLCPMPPTRGTTPS